MKKEKTNKKSQWKPWHKRVLLGVLILFVLMFGIAGVAGSMAEKDHLKEVALHDPLEDALAFDQELYKIALDIDSSYRRLSEMDNFRSDVEAYDLLKDIREEVSSLEDIPNIKDYNIQNKNEANEYIDSVDYYSSLVIYLCDNGMDYIQEDDVEAGSKYKSAAEELKYYSGTLLVKRLSFLQASGLSDEEANEILTSDE